MSERASEASPPRPRRLLVVLPSWVGDAVMATPTLRALRAGFPGAFIGGLVRPGIDQVLAGTPFLDEFHVERAAGVMGPKHAAAKVRPRRYDVALLLTNSFSTALTTRIAGIPRRIGYDRDGRGLLLTDRMAAPKREDGRWAPVPAVEYYFELARRFLVPGAAASPGLMELGIAPEQDILAEQVLGRAGIETSDAFVVLNPGGNNPAKRWPAERFAEIAGRIGRRGIRVLVNAAPAEAELAAQIVAGTGAVSLAPLGGTLGSLKGIVRRSRLMVTNDTGPRHIAAALGVPVVTLFGPTDHRWTTIPTRPQAPEVILVADPTLPEELVADEHPERCRIDRIDVEQVWRASAELLGIAG